MGNQMPITHPCNPVCCAMCINPGRADLLGDDLATGDSAGGGRAAHGGPGGGAAAAAGGGRAAIFANAASVLSTTAAEEITMDDYLHKELANEVELWRMETSGGAVLQEVLPSSKGTFGGGLLSARSDTSGPTSGHQGRGGAAAAAVAVPFADRDRDRSLSPPPRTQLSLHDRQGLGPPPGTPTGGIVRTRRPSGSVGTSAPLAEARERTAFRTPAQPRGSAGVHARAAPEAVPPAVFVAAMAAPPPGPDAAAGASPSGGAAAPDNAAEPAAGDAAAGSPRGEVPPVAEPRCGESPPAVNPTVDPAARAATAAVLAPEARQQDSTSLPEAPSRSTSSSDGSTFVGFIEDPLEQERSGEVHIWLGSMNAPSAMRQPEPPGAAIRDAEVEEVVQPDRSHLF